MKAGIGILVYASSLMLCMAAGRYLSEPYFTMLALASIFGTLIGVWVVARLIRNPQPFEDLVEFGEVRPGSYLVPLAPTVYFWVGWLWRADKPSLATTIVLAMVLWTIGLFTLKALGFLRAPTHPA